MIIILEKCRNRVVFWWYVDSEQNLLHLQAEYTIS